MPRQPSPLRSLVSPASTSREWKDEGSVPDGRRQAGSGAARAGCDAGTAFRVSAFANDRVGVVRPGDLRQRRAGAWSIARSDRKPVTPRGFGGRRTDESGSHDPGTAGILLGPCQLPMARRCASWLAVMKQPRTSARCHPRAADGLPELDRPRAWLRTQPFARPSMSRAKRYLSCGVA